MSLASFHVSGNLAGLLIEYLEAHAVGDAGLCQRLMVFGPGLRMTYAQWWRFLEEVQALWPSRPVGLELGQMLRLDHLGVLSYLALTSASVADAWAQFQRYQALLHTGGWAKTTLRDGQVGVVWGSDFGDDSSRLSSEVLVSGMLGLLRAMTGRREIVPARLEFMFPRPENVSDYASLFQCPIAFESSNTSIWIPAAYFGLPVVHCDSQLESALAPQAEARFADFKVRDDFAQALHKAIVHALSRGTLSIDRIAASLSLSRRTLQRHLATHDQRFKDVVENVRLRLAQQYLQERRVTLAETALLLGFSEQSAFTRAFRRWKGQTPAAYSAAQAAPRTL